jgi:hypothetical protein
MYYYYNVWCRCHDYWSTECIFSRQIVLKSLVFSMSCSLLYLY